MTLDLRYAGVLVCFALSGLAALVYQTAWTREFAHVFGTSELAVATVLAGYMGGLAAGAALAARWAARVRRPVRVYGLLELGIALSALAVPLALRGSRSLYAAVLGARADAPDAGGLGAALFYLACAFAILAVPTGLMGATLPLLARHAVRHERELGRRVGWLYAINTAGAVAGTLLAAFALLPWLGLRATVQVAVGVNALVFGVAFALARGAAGVTPQPPRAAASAPNAWMLAAIAVSGVISFTYEVLWTRLLGHVLGGSVYAFATMLASFLVGIALGAALATRFARSVPTAIRGFGWAQLGIALFSLAAFALLDQAPELAAALARGGTGRLGQGALVCAATLLPATLCVGATFPLAVRVVARGAHDAGPASARVYAWNTLGAIVGAVGAGFFAVPALGYAGALGVAVALNLGLAAASGLAARPRSPLLLAACALALAALVVLPPRTPWRLLRSAPLSPGRPVGGAITYYAVGRSSTVLLVEQLGGWSLRTNGLPESTIARRGTRPGRLASAAWLGVLPVLARPDTRSMLVVGLGGGRVVEAVPHGVEHIEVVELEPEVVSANRAVARERLRDPLADPRVELRLNDARTALFLTRRHFDAVVSQPSHPWTAGASHLYTREFFVLVRDRLAPGGAFVQWINAAFVDASLLRSLVATLLDVFPSVRVYQPEGEGDLLFLASDQPLPVEQTSARALAGAPQAFAELGLLAPEDVAAWLLLDEAGARRFAAGAQLSRDDHNLLQIGSPRVLDAALRPADVRALLADFDPLAEPVPGLDALHLVRRWTQRGQRARARRLAEALPDPLLGGVALAHLEAAGGRPGQAREGLEAVLREAPRLEVARAALAELAALRHGSSTDGGAPRASGEPEASADSDAVEAGWRLRSARDWAELRALDARLAALAPRHALFVEALRLRIDWRAASAEPGLARQGIALADTLIALTRDADDQLRRARLGEVAGDPEVLLASLSELARRRGLRREPRIAAEARALLEGTRIALDGSGLGAWREALRARLRPRPARGARPDEAPATPADTASP